MCVFLGQDHYGVLARHTPGYGSAYVACDTRVATAQTCLRHTEWVAHQYRLENDRIVEAREKPEGPVVQARSREIVVNSARNSYSCSHLKPSVKSCYLNEAYICFECVNRLLSYRWMYISDTRQRCERELKAHLALLHFVCVFNCYYTHIYLNCNNISLKIVKSLIQMITLGAKCATKMLPRCSRRFTWW